ncbi:MAG: acetyl-CoA carboxylase, partial [Liquorilactobacillus satsumensis]
MNNDVEIIMGRLTLLFKRQSRTRYWLMIANDPYDQTGLKSIFETGFKRHSELRL